MTKTFAVHSYKGGTGKTVIAANLAAYYAHEGYRVCLLDFDFRAPSLHTLFPQYTSCFTNDLLDGGCSIQEILVRHEHPLITGELWVGISNRNMEAICAIAERGKQWQVQAIKNILNAKKQLELAEVDFLIFDVTPGVEQIALNAIFASDVVIIVLKPDKYGIEGTRQLIQSLYQKLEQEVRLIENKCFEESHREIDNIPVINSIHCMCDVSKDGDKKIYTLEEPAHPFTLEIARIAQSLQTQTTP